MRYHPELRTVDFAAITMLNLSEDGYVRLTCETFFNLPLIHLLSGLDEHNQPLCSEGAITTFISGYTEWLSTTTPVVTLGWDWQLEVLRGEPKCVQVGKPRSNIMLLNDCQQDLGPAKTATLIKTKIDQLTWQDVVLQNIRTLST
jgi:hypothetical protein